MEATAQSQLQRAELETVLGSGIFNRAPNLASFLKYICNQHFEGAGDQIKEYNIAVEALGRSPDFDQKKDSIVRVEAHRLRKRLAEYYATAGADHLLQIIIPSGQYAPKFIDKYAPIAELPKQELGEVQLALAHSEILPSLLTQETDTVDPVVIDQVSRFQSRNLLVVLSGVLLIVILTSWINRRSTGAMAMSSGGEIWTGNFNEPASSEFRILAGYHGPPFTDRQGHRWLPDAYFKGGHSVAINPLTTIEGLPDPALPKTRRDGEFLYEIPLRPGTYELHLYFAETDIGRRQSNEGDEVRNFRVRSNGETILDLFDAMSEAGAPNRLQVRVFKDVGPAKDGKLHLEFTQQTGQPILNAIEILSSEPGKIRPIRIVTHRTPVTDADGRVWAADEFVIGGHLVERSTSVSNVRQKNLFEGERFGNFAYHLPVAPGKYRLTLHFAETYFGSNIPNSPPFHAGARVFDVFANGTPLLRDFDLGTAAGGPNRGIERIFENLQPNAQGLIVLEFKPLRNYPCVNAIELEETN